MYINALAITLICVIVIDNTDFVDTITSKIKYLLTNGKLNSPIDIKPFTCSMCMSFWTNMLYFIINKEITILNILYILVLGFLTPIFNKLIIKVINKLDIWLN
jgi:hypothetical protein